jgi:DNA (cytosine-5)-methyltransferase 1
MRFLSVCSGIEAASVAWKPLGWKASGFAEIEPFPCAVLAHHYPDVPNHGDMMLLPSKIRAGEVEAPDLLCGGTPCQAFSVAGLRQSLDDARGNLTLTFCEIADAIDSKREQPCIVFWENVPGVLNTKDNAFGCFLGALAGEDDALVAPGGRWANAGFVDGPQRAVAWRVLDAQYFGVAQRRRRVFVVASARADFDPAAVLFEFEGVRRDTAPSREAGQAAARIVAPSLTASNDPSRSPQSSEVTQQVAAVVAARMVAFGEYVDDGTASAMKARDYKDATDLVAQPISYGIPGNWIGRQPENGGNSTQFMEEVAPCLTSADKHGVAQPIAFEPGKLKRLGYGDAEPGLSPTLRADAGDNQLAVAQPVDFRNLKYHEGEVAGTMQAKVSGGYSLNYMTGIQQHMAVRRLTPVECERLQGFSDNYTNIPWRKQPTAPDGPRYKALGNSWAVPVVRWIGERIVRSLA